MTTAILFAGVAIAVATYMTDRALAQNERLIKEGQG